MISLIALTRALYPVFAWTHGIVAPGIPVNTGLPTISGTVHVGLTLSVSNGSWTHSPTSYTFQWKNEGVSLSGGGNPTTSSYTLQTSDIGCLITCTVTATNGAGTSAPALTALAGPTIGATVRYVSIADGLDTNDGTTSTPGAPHGPWKTLTHVNAQSSLPAGTSVLFKRGEVWRTDGNSPYSLGAALIPTSSGTVGNPIVFGAYGTGANPIIDGSFDASSTSAWVVTGTPNVWQSIQTFKPASFVSVTFIGSNPNVTSNGPQTPVVGQAIVFYGTLPSNLSLTTTYYIKSVSGNTFQFALTPTGTAITPNASGSATLGGNGFPYNIANDVGNLLWGFSFINPGAADPRFGALTNTIYGVMAGNGAGGVWYRPGDGAASGLTTPGQYNFNTDNWTVQVYSTSNPATVMPGLSIAISTATIYVIGVSNLIFENLTLQYGSWSNILSQNTNNNITVRDCVLQWCGGGNLAGGSGLDSRAGDTIDIQGSTGDAGSSINGWLIERNLMQQPYDICIGPNCGGAHQDNIVVRNNLAFNCGGWISDFTGSGGTTAIGLTSHNNTVFCNPTKAWSYSPNQRPRPNQNIFGVEIQQTTQTGISIKNNIFAGIGGGGTAPGFGIVGVTWVGASNPSNPYTSSGDWLDFNCWPINPNTGLAQQIALDSLHGGNVAISTWAPGTYTGSGASTFSPALEVGGIFVDPAFTSQSTFNFVPTAGSPCRNTGTNLYSQGVVWDINHNPRPSTGTNNFTMGAFQ